MSKSISVYYLGLLGMLGLPATTLAQVAPAKPAAAKPAIAKPIVAKPAVARPVVAKPAVKPAIVKPAAPAAAKPAIVKPAAPATKPAVVPAIATQPAEPVATPAPAARPAATGPAVRYAVSFPNAVHHEARIKATFSGLTPGKTLTVRMARSSPGRYALHEFIKNVYYVTATDGGGKLLNVNRSDPYSWDIKPAADGTVQFEYTLYGDRSDGTYAGIDQQHAHLNIPATLCYAQGLEGRAAEVKFELPSGWKVATQLRALGEDRTTFAAPNLQYLMDSPVVLGSQHTLHTWQDGGRTFEMATFYTGPATEVETLVKKTQQVVREAAGIFGGEYPAFDYGRYTFLADYLPQATGDGMEHRNSTSLTSNLPLQEEGALRNLGTVSHEFFHAYNTERLRSKGLEPFDFQRVNMSDALWFGEGFTQYYGELMLRRAGYYDNEQFLDKVSQWVNVRVNAPGARYASAVDMSRQAGFVDAATSVDPNNRVNTYLSYYYQGAGLALTLDLQLRQRYRTSLDKYMQALWQEYGKPQTPSFAPAKPYTLPDLQRVLGVVAKDTAFAGTFFRRYIYGHDTPRFAENLALAGLAVIPNKVLAAALPRQVEFTEDGRCILSRNTTLGSGLYKAGIDRGDEIMTLDGVKITDLATLEGVMRKHTPADLVPVRVRSRAGVERTTQVVLTEDTNVQVQPMENVEKMTATQAQKDLRAAWLASAAAIKP